MWHEAGESDKRLPLPGVGLTSPQVGYRLGPLMKRAGAPVTLETLLEEAKLILRTLQRTDLFGDEVRLTEAERVLDNSISLNFADYCGFLAKFEYVHADSSANTVAVTEHGAEVASNADPEFHARLARHFSKELEASVSQPPEPVAPASMRLGSRPSQTRSPSMSTTSDDILDRRYRKESLLGEGILGPVFVGRHVALGRRVAIKEVRTIFTVAAYLRRDEILIRLRERLEAHAALVHPFILGVLDQNLDREVPYVVQGLAESNVRAYVDGLNEASNGKSGKPAGAPIAPAIRILMQLAEALRYAHSKGVLHGNLKPENVLLDACGNVLVTDFGMSSIGDRDVAGEDLKSNPPIVIGSSSVAYLPPERLTNASEGSIQSDLYAFGLLAYELLMGKLPGRRSPLPSDVRSEIPPAFDDVFDRLTRDAMSERYDDFDECVQALRAALPSEWTGAEGTVPFAVDQVQAPPEPVVAGPGDANEHGDAPRA